LSNDLKEVVQKLADSMSPSSPLHMHMQVCLLRTNEPARVDDPAPVEDPEKKARIEHAKQGMWQAVRDGYRTGTPMQTPPSFLALDEDGRKAVAKLTVDWVLCPVNEATAKWFDAFVENEDVQPYLKHTVPQFIMEEVCRIESLSAVLDGLKDYDMLIPKS
jgi:hypothetical protein